MKKVLALLTALTMLFSVVPMVYADGETAPSAYDVADIAVIDFTPVGGTSVDTANADMDLQTWANAGSKIGFKTTVNFGETAPESLGCIVRTAWSGSADGELYFEVDGEVIGKMPAWNTGGYHNWITRHFEVSNPSVCVGEKEVFVYIVSKAGGTVYGKFKSFQFYTDSTGLTIGNAAYGSAYENFQSWMASIKEGTDRRYDVDFGNNTSDLTLELTRTYSSNTSVPASSLYLGNTLLAEIPAAEATANVPLIQSIKILDSSVCTGQQVIKFADKGVRASTYDVKFVKVVNPYENMLSDSEVITGSNVKIFNQLMFGENGTKSVDITYTGAGAISFAKDMNDTEPVTLTLPQATESTTVTLDFDNFAYLKGLVETLIVMDGNGDGSVKITQIKFNENLLNDQFAGATKVYVNYIGEGADWYSDIQTEFEAANAQDGRTFETDVINMSEFFSTDFEKLNYVKSYTTDANIVFIQAGDYARVILDNLAAMENPPIVILVGTADYAETFSVSAISAGTGALSKEANYNVPFKKISPIYTTGLDMGGYAYRSHIYANWSGTKIGGLHPWPTYIRYDDIDLSLGVASIAVKHDGKTTAPDTVLDIRLDSQDGPVLATFTQRTSQGTSVQEVTGKYSGVHDIYLCVRLADNSPTTSWDFGFGDIHSVIFTPRIDDTAYTIGLDLANPDSKTLYTQNINPDGTLGALHPWPSYSEYKSVNLYKGVSKILLKSKYLPTNDTYYELKKDTKAVIRVGDPKTGDVLATFDQILGWVSAEKLTREAEVTGNYQGMQDIYLCIENENYVKANGEYYHGFSDIYSVVFVPGNVTEEAETIAYTNGLTPANADSNELAQVNGNLFLANGESVTYSKVAFGEDEIKVLKANLAATEGTLTVTSGETEIATFDLTNKSGNFENVMAVSDVTLTGTMPFTFTYTGTNGCYLKNVEFVNLDAYSTTLNYTNYAEVDPGLKNPSAASGWDRLPVTVDTNIGKFKSMIDNYIKWEGVNFGEEAKKATVEIGYASIAPYSGATISIYIDSISPENKIAETIAEAHHYDWNYRVSNIELVNRYITGYHDVYLVVNSNYNSGYAASRDASADIFDVKFAEFSTEDEYYVETKEIDRSYYNSELKKWVKDIRFSKQVAVSFVKNETSPASYMLIAAAYDVTTGALAGVETAKAETVDGLNVATVRLKYRDFGIGQYLFKYFVWDGETLKPLADGSDTLEVSEIDWSK